MLRVGLPLTEKAPKTATARDEFDSRFASMRPRLLRICHSFIGGDAAEDVVHDTYLRGRERFHQLRDPTRFDAWLTRIAINLCFSWHRGRRPSTRQVIAGPSLTPGSQQRDAGLLELIEALPARDRTLIVLHYGYGYSFVEIADLFGISSGTARAAVLRARTKLARQLLDAEK
jgi:RNA polymerase sigma-70 factor (ECF subfamily)